MHRWNQRDHFFCAHLATGLALMVFFSSLITGCLSPGALDPVSGLMDYRMPVWVEVPGGQVDVAGGNLIVRRLDFSVDTSLGTLEVGAVYNSTSGEWIWPFQSTYDGVTFVDDSGAVYDLSDVVDGAAIPGSHWRKIDSRRIATRGGLTHEFEPESNRLMRIGWESEDDFALVFLTVPGVDPHRTAKVQQCVKGTCSDVYEIGYDERGCVSSLVDRSSRESIFVNDEQCRPVKAQDPLARDMGWPGTLYEYDESHLTAVTNSEGVRFEYAYIEGHLMAASSPQLPHGLTTFSYGARPGQELYYTRVIEPGGADRWFTYDEKGRLSSLRDLAGGVQTFEWEGLRPSLSVSQTGQITHWTYLDDDPIRIEWPDGNIMEIQYEAGAQNRTYTLASPRASVTDSVGLMELNQYDDRGRLIATYNGELEATRFGHWESGQVSYIRNALGETTFLHDYGEHGHPERIVKKGLTEYRGFDAVGNLLAGSYLEGPVDPGRPGIVSRRFDANRNLVALTLEGGIEGSPLAQETLDLEVQYRSDGRPVRISRPYGGDARFDYDAAGQLVARSERVDGLWQTTRFEYGSSGRLTATEWPNRVRHEVDYNAAGEPVTLRLLQDHVVEKTLNSTWDSGQLVSRRDADRPGLEEISYDEVGRVKAIHFPEGETIQFERDLRGREIKRTYLMPGADVPLRTLSWFYDAADRAIEWRDDDQVILQREYDLGLLLTETTGNGLERKFVHDEQSGLLSEVHTNPVDGGWPFLFTTYLWEDCGSQHYCMTVSTVGETEYGPMGAAVGGIESYRVGPIPDGLTGADLSGARIRHWGSFELGQGNHLNAGEYGFDAMGNWLGVWLGSDPIARFSYNPERNRLRRADLIDSHSYTWDESGFMRSRDGETMTWDAGGRPAHFGQLEMRWDALGRLISWNSGGEVRQVLFGGRVSGDEDRNPTGIDLGEVSIDLTSGDRTYRHIDLRGNVQFVSDENGEISRYYTYSPFGVASAWGEGSDRRTFAQGQEMGEFVWLGNRLYDSEVGRFISPDPEYQMINQFSYTLGNPVHFWDPDGRHAVPTRVVRMAEMTMDVALRIETFGYAAFASGLALGSFHVAVGGVVAVLTGMVLGWVVEIGCGCVGSVTIEDLPDGYSPGEGSESSGSSSSAESVGDVSTCSPQTLESQSGQIDRGWLWIPLQMGLATLFLRFLRRRRSR